jgi:hypothetical protein
MNDVDSFTADDGAPHLHSTNVTLVAYWRSKAENGRVPRKDCIDPTEIPKLLPDLVIYERIAPDHFRVRVIGTRVTARLGVDPTGGNIFELFAERFKAGVMTAMNRVLDEPCAQVLTVRDHFPSGRRLLVEVVRLPLADETGDVRYILSSTAEIRPAGFALKGEAPQTIAEPVDNAFFSVESMLGASA